MTSKETDMKPFLSLTSLLLVCAAPAAAQSQDKDIVYRDVTVIDMGDLNVSATIQGPDGVLVNQRPKPKFNPLIKLRKNFDTEVEQSIDEVR
jgi:hypothetical protein